MKKILLILALVLTTMLSVSVVSASLSLDSINFDPAIVAAGDEVDIVVQYLSDGLGDESNDPESYKYEIKLLPGDDLTKDYILFMDSTGDNLESIISGNLYNKKYRVKVKNDAPTGTYTFKLEGSSYHNGRKSDAISKMEFTMDVKKEGVNLGISNVLTSPREVRPGDNYVRLTSFIENIGQKDAKSIEVRLLLPEGFESSLTNNNRVWLGRINAGERQESNFLFDLDKYQKPGLYNLKYYMKYLDLDDNSYEVTKNIPILIKERPYLEVTEYKGEGLAGNSGKLYVMLKNTGSESAESIDVRIVKQNSQPFDFDIRSDYVGELKPNETGVAVFNLKINSDAEIKDHDFKLLIRSKGDSDEGDDNIYTYDRRAKFRVTGVAESKLKLFGLIGAVLVILFLFGNIVFKKVNSKKSTSGKKK